jgi:hypothetical protein
MNRHSDSDQGKDDGNHRFLNKIDAQTQAPPQADDCQDFRPEGDGFVHKIIMDELAKNLVMQQPMVEPLGTPHKKKGCQKEKRGCGKQREKKPYGSQKDAKRTHPDKKITLDIHKDSFSHSERQIPRRWATGRSPLTP